jgi:oligopeptide/dipeptide ABC transporter ATP-binding protein
MTQTPNRLHHRAEPGDEILSVRGLAKRFPIRSGFLRREISAVRAVDDVDITLRAGETLGLVGESGCGKTTFGRMILRLLDADAGTITFRGTDVTHWKGSMLRELRREIQIVFQDPYGALNPRRTVGDIIAEPLRIHGRYDDGGSDRIHQLLQHVGLEAAHAARYPHEFSGGQQQRIGIARALALNPQLLVLDEPVSALDVSIQAQVINLLDDLQQEFGLAYLFIAHDLSVVRHVSDRVAVMYLGRIVETGRRDDIYRRPTHPYTKALLSAVPIPDPDLRDTGERIILSGDVPNPADPPSGCRFRTRCWKAQELCAAEEPQLTERASGVHWSACHFPEPAPDPAGGSDNKDPHGLP